MNFDDLDRQLRRFTRALAAPYDPTRRARPADPDQVLLLVDGSGRPLEQGNPSWRPLEFYASLLARAPETGAAMFVDSDPTAFEAAALRLNGVYHPAGALVTLLSTPRLPQAGPWLTVAGDLLAPGTTVIAEGRPVGVRQPLMRIPKSLHRRGDTAR